MKQLLSKEWNTHIKQLFKPYVKRVEIKYYPDKSFMTYNESSGNLSVVISEYVKVDKPVDFELWQVADLFHEIGHYVFHTYSFTADVLRGTWVHNEGYTSRELTELVNVIDDVRIDYHNCKKYYGYLQSEKQKVEEFSEKMRNHVKELTLGRRRKMATVYNVHNLATGKPFKDYGLVDGKDLEQIKKYMKRMVKIPADNYEGSIQKRLRLLFNAVLDFYSDKTVENEEQEMNGGGQAVGEQDIIEDGKRFDPEEATFLGKNHVSKENDIRSNMRLEEAGVSLEDVDREIGNGETKKERVDFPVLERELKKFFGSYKRVRADNGKFNVNYYLHSLYTPTTRVFRMNKLVDLQNKWLFLIDSSGSTEERTVNRNVKYPLRIYEQEFLVVDAMIRYLPKNSVFEIWEFSSHFMKIASGSGNKVSSIMWEKGIINGGTVWTTELYQMLLDKERAGYQIVILTDGVVDLDEDELRVFMDKQVKKPIIFLFMDHVLDNWASEMRLGKDYGIITGYYEEIKVSEHMREVLRRWKY